MQMPRVRLTLRQAMVAVAFLAIALYSEMTRRRWALYRDRASYHE